MKEKKCANEGKRRGGNVRRGGAASALKNFTKNCCRRESSRFQVPKKKVIQEKRNLTRPQLVASRKAGYRPKNFGAQCEEEGRQRKHCVRIRLRGTEPKEGGKGGGSLCGSGSKRNQQKPFRDQAEKAGLTMSGKEWAGEGLGNLREQSLMKNKPFAEGGGKGGGQTPRMAGREPWVGRTE